MKEYTIVAEETVQGTFYIRANTEEEALEKFKEMTIDGGYRDMMEDVVSFNYKVIDHTIIDGTEIETMYCPEGDTTFIMEYTYRCGEVVAEQILGYYHGMPNDGDTETYKSKGTACVLL